MLPTCGPALVVHHFYKALAHLLNCEAFDAPILGLKLLRAGAGDVLRVASNDTVTAEKGHRTSGTLLPKPAELSASCLGASSSSSRLKAGLPLRASCQPALRQLIGVQVVEPLFLGQRHGVSVDERSQLEILFQRLSTGRRLRQRASGEILTAGKGFELYATTALGRRWR